MYNCCPVIDHTLRMLPGSACRQLLALTDVLDMVAAEHAAWLRPGLQAPPSPTPRGPGLLRRAAGIATAPVRCGSFLSKTLWQYPVSPQSMHLAAHVRLHQRHHLSLPQLVQHRNLLACFCPKA